MLNVYDIKSGTTWKKMYSSGCVRLLLSDHTRPKRERSCMAFDTRRVMHAFGKAVVTES